MNLLQFPQDFYWGVASASYQVEGATREGGRGESIWDRFASIPGNIDNGDTGDVACDHYHRFREDVALMREMGLKAYRFSIAWPRIIPDGNGAVNSEGLQFYSDLVDALLEAEITPFITLYHWDLPQAMQDIGGWTNPAMPEYFLRYCQAVMERLGDRVRHWITLNEPFCTAFLGNYDGCHAPGLHDFSTALLVTHTLYIGHGLVVRYFRESGMEGEIGIALNLMSRLPATNSPEDHAAVRRADGYQNRWFLEPILLGRYPEDMVHWYRSQGVVLPTIQPEDMKLIAQPLDFIGINYYNDLYVRHDASVWPVQFSATNPRWKPVNDRGWLITETGFYNMLMRLTREYGVEKIIVTENGTATHEIPNINGQVEDPQRVDYLYRHLEKMQLAIADGANVTGYMLWAFSDNFEWAFGYNSRFGLVYVDFETQERIIKQSGRWYADIIANNAIPRRQLEE